MTYNSTNFAPTAGIQALTVAEVDSVAGGLPKWLSTAGGVAFGVAEGVEVAGALRAGLLGARIGGFAGPIGFAAGAVGGIGAYYILRRI